MAAPATTIPRIDRWILRLVAAWHPQGRIRRLRRQGLPPQPGLDAAICIPARQEEELIGRCAATIAEQAARCGVRAGLVLAINNSHDDSFGAAWRHAARPGLPVLAVEAQVPAPHATAPKARRWAMEMGARLLAPGGALLTTDADSLPAPGWLDANLAELAAGHDAVCGMVLADEAEMCRLPQLSDRAHRLEWRYRQALLELDALLDPDPVNPWPHHGQAAGPSLAVRLAAYRAVGGLPVPAAGEDRALVARLRAAGFRVRHSAAAVVTTSCRLQGRAADGLADFLARRGIDGDSACDGMLEDAHTAWLRASRRRLLRRAGDRAEVRRAASGLALTPERLEAMWQAGSFAPAWALLEQASPLLRRREIRPSGVAAQLPAIGAMLQALRRRAGAIPGSAGPGDSPFDARLL